MKNMYWGAFTSNDLTDTTLTALRQFEQNVRKEVSIVSIYQGWEPGCNDSFNPPYMAAVHAHGAIPMITWEPYDYRLDPANQPVYALSNILAGNFDAYITSFAEAARMWGHPFFLRFAHEMNGNWYPWSEGANGNIQGQYVAAWQHVHDLFQAVGVSNVTWVWCPNVISPTTIPLSGLYPGNAYVDWVGMDGYNFGNVESWSTWISFSTVFLPTYTELLSLTQKPMLVCETASAESGGSKASWISNMLTKELLSNFPVLSGVIWFNIKKETDWRIESSMRAQHAFANGIALANYQAANYTALTTSISLP